MYISKSRDQGRGNRVPTGQHLRWTSILRCEHLRCASILRCARGWYGCGGRPLRSATGGRRKRTPPYFFRRAFSSIPPEPIESTLVEHPTLRASYAVPGSQVVSVFSVPRSRCPGSQVVSVLSAPRSRCPGSQEKVEDKKSLVSRNSLGSVGYRTTLDSRGEL